MLNPTEQAILDLRNPLIELFHALHRSEEYSCHAGAVQIEVFFRGEKVGGINRDNWRLYISKVFAGTHGSTKLLESYGFEWKEHSPSHQYWFLHDAADHQLFRRVIEEMTGVPVILKKL